MANSSDWKESITQVILLFVSPKSSETKNRVKQKTSSPKKYNYQITQNQWYEKRIQNKKYWIAKISNLNELAEGSLVILGLLLSTCPTMKEDGWDWVTNQKFKG